MRVIGCLEALASRKLSSRTLPLTWRPPASARLTAECAVGRTPGSHCDSSRFPACMLPRTGNSDTRPFRHDPVSPDRIAAIIASLYLIWYKFLVLYFDLLVLFI